MAEPSVVDWLSWCAGVGAGFPEAALFRRMIQHDQWYRCGDDVYCSSALVPSELKSMPTCWNGLQLASSVGDEDGADGASSVRFHYAPGSPPLCLNQQQALHLRSFVKSKCTTLIPYLAPPVPVDPALRLTSLRPRPRD